MLNVWGVLVRGGAAGMRWGSAVVVSLGVAAGGVSAGQSGQAHGGWDMKLGLSLAFDGAGV
jgi:hypothetical protein